MRFALILTNVLIDLNKSIIFLYKKTGTASPVVRVLKIYL
jgi:hypothetical protein